MATVHADVSVVKTRVETLNVGEAVRGVLADVLALRPATARGLAPATALFGSLPELDSMAVASVLTEMEDRLGIVIDDDEVDGEMFATFGSLVAFARAKVGHA